MVRFRFASGSVRFVNFSTGDIVCTYMHYINILLTTGKTIQSRSIVLRRKVANTPLTTHVELTEHQSCVACVFLAGILGRTQNLHLAVNGWFMQRRSRTSDPLFA